MTKIDIDKFVASLIEFSPQQSMKYIKALADQGLKYKDGEIVSIDSDFTTITIPKDLKGTDTDGGVVGEKGEQGEQFTEEEMVGMGELGKVWNEQAIISRLDKIIELLSKLSPNIYPYIPLTTSKRPLDPDPNVLGGWTTTV